MEYKSNFFDDVRHKVCIRRLHCDDACFWLWKMKTKNNIYISSLASYCSAVLSILKQELDFCGFNWSKGSSIEVALYDRQFFNVCEFTGGFFLGGGPGSKRLLYNHKNCLFMIFIGCSHEKKNNNFWRQSVT